MKIEKGHRFTSDPPQSRKRLTLATSTHNSLNQFIRIQARKEI